MGWGRFRPAALHQQVSFDVLIVMKSYAALVIISTLKRSIRRQGKVTRRDQDGS